MVEDMTRHGEAPKGASVPGLRRPSSGAAASVYFGAAHYWHKRAQRAERLAFGFGMAAGLAAIAWTLTALALQFP